jgi:preprotein translocase subunit SecG
VGRFMIIAIIFIIVVGIIAVVFMYSDVGKQLTSSIDLGSFVGSGQKITTREAKAKAWY